mmetsp:Transcript_13546/g.25526  ORF Transcript_13546/g.25526 Transcript_13546/m.25526 type:complete len:286 (+) Transcript_13546:1432-2289(+)
MAQHGTFDIEFWPEDDLAMKFNYVRIPSATASADEEVVSRMERKVKESKQKLELLREEHLDKEARDCTFSPTVQSSSRRGLRDFLCDQSHFLKEKELNLQKLRRQQRDLKKEVWPYKPTINESSMRLAQNKLRKPLIDRLAKPPLKIRHFNSETPKVAKALSAIKTNQILETQLKKELKSAWLAEGFTDGIAYIQLGHLLLELNFIKPQDTHLLNKIWAKLNKEGQVSLTTLTAFLLQESRLNGLKPNFDSLYFNRSLSASRSRTRTDTETSATTSCDVKPLSHA